MYVYYDNDIASAKQSLTTKHDVNFTNARLHYYCDKYPHYENDVGNCLQRINFRTQKNATHRNPD